MAAAERDTPQDDREAREHLRNEVTNLIRPFRTSTDRPPFTLGELIVIAILIRKKKNDEEDMIVKWIFDTFEYYRRPENHSVFGYGCTQLRIEGFVDAFSNIETPIKAKTITKTHYQQQYWDSGYTVNTAAARLYLAPQLEPPRNGKFHFLDLPTELRNRIYNMLFVHDTPLTSQDECHPDGTLHGRSAGNLICLTSRYHKASRFPRTRLEFHALHRGRCGKHLHVESPATTLALTQTCKQVYEESKSIFYGMNTFVFEDQKAFLNRGLRMGRNFQRLRKVSIELRIDAYQYEHGEPIEELRAQLNGLKQLPSLRLDRLILPHEIREPAEGEEDCNHCNQTGVHDLQFTALGDLLDPIVSLAKRAKKVEIGYMPRCTSLKRFILRRVAERPMVKMLCCSNADGKEGDEFKLF